MKGGGEQAIDLLAMLAFPGLLGRGLIEGSS